MKSYLFAIVFFVFSLNACTQHSAQAAGSVSTEQSAPPSYRIVKNSTADSLKIVSLLQEAKSVNKENDLVMFFARKFLKCPYVAKTLDQEEEECLVINTTGLDCTTFVENVLALAWCAKHKQTTFQDFCNALVKVRYIGGEVAYTSRQHYFTIWMEDNVKENIVKRINLPDAPLSAKRKPQVNYMTTHVNDYTMLSKHPQWIVEIDKMEKRVNNIELTYIPKQQLAKSEKYRQHVKDGDIIGIVTNKKGLDISHVGFAVWHEDGLHMMHASSNKAIYQVIEDPQSLYQYLQKQPSAVGISIVRML